MFDIFLDDAPALVVVLPLLISAIIAFMPSKIWPWIVSVITLLLPVSYTHLRAHETN